jgi:hypothetical protein
MGSDKKPKGGGGGGYKWGSGLIWAGGQFAVTWFLTPETHLLTVISACFSAFLSGWTTSALLGRFAKWGANAWVMMILGVLLGVAVFSGAFSGLEALVGWLTAKGILGGAVSALASKPPSIDWDRVMALLLSWSVLPPAALGLLTGLYVRMKVPRGGGGGKK